MRHTYECPVRWADIDMMQHVNNVTYVDYLQEARIDMFAAHPEFRGAADLAEGAVVVRHELDFVAPMAFRKRPVAIDSWVTEIKAGSFTMAYEIYDDTPAGRVVYLRASTVMAAFVFASESPRRISAAERAVLEHYLEESTPRDSLAGAGSARHVFPLQVRWSDVDAYRHVNNVKYVEYFQEARIAYMMRLHQEGDTFGEFVVARTDIDYLRPIGFRREPYAVHSWISYVGRSSFRFTAEVRDPGVAAGEPGAVLARSHVVAVGFDTRTQRSAPLTEDHRARLLAELEG